MTWSGMRKKLEEDYLAESLRGHIRYYAVSYNRDHDREGSAAILLDGREMIRGCYWNNFARAEEFPQDDKLEKRLSEEFAFMDDTALRLGVFDQRCFYEAFGTFDSQSVEKSLESENELVRIFAVLDRRVGRRRLERMRKNSANEPEVFLKFLNVRLKAEGML